jgi:hypothetical protein
MTRCEVAKTATDERVYNWLENGMTTWLEAWVLCAPWVEIRKTKA